MHEQALDDPTLGYAAVTRELLRTEDAALLGTYRRVHLLTGHAESRYTAARFVRFARARDVVRLLTAPQYRDLERHWRMRSVSSTRASNPSRTRGVMRWSYGC